jgi:hypothetical protein
VTLIADAVRNFQKGQNEVRSSIDSKLDKFRKGFMVNIEDKFKVMKLDFDRELGKYQRQNRIAVTLY